MVSQSIVSSSCSFFLKVTNDLIEGYSWSSAEPGLGPLVYLGANVGLPEPRYTRVLCLDLGLGGDGSGLMGSRILSWIYFSFLFSIQSPISVHELVGDGRVPHVEESLALKRPERAVTCLLPLGLAMLGPVGCSVGISPSGTPASGSNTVRT